MTITVDSETGNKTFTADTGKAICAKGESGPTTITTASAPAETPDDAWTDCCYGTVNRYSVRSIIRELKAIDKFTAVRTLLETANYDWDFIGSNYLSSDDTDFQTMMAAIVSQGILTQAELDTLLPKCIWEQTAMV